MKTYTLILLIITQAACLAYGMERPKRDREKETEAPKSADKQPAKKKRKTLNDEQQALANETLLAALRTRDAVRMRLALKAGAQIDQEEIIKSMGTYVELLYMLFSNNAANDSDLDALANILKYVSYEDALTFIRKGGLFDEITQNAIANVLIDRLTNTREKGSHEAYGLMELFLTLHITDDLVLKKLNNVLDESTEPLPAELRNPLIQALLFNDNEYVQGILSRLAKQYAFSQDDLSTIYDTLIFASGHGDVCLVKMILNNFGLELFDNNIEDAMVAASLQGEVGTFEALLKTGIMPRTTLASAINNALLTAVAQRYIPLVESILRNDNENPVLDLDLDGATDHLNNLLTQEFSPDLRKAYETIRTLIDDYASKRLARRIMRDYPPSLEEEEESYPTLKERLQMAKNQLLRQEEQKRSSILHEGAQGERRKRFREKETEEPKSAGVEKDKQPVKKKRKTSNDSMQQLADETLLAALQTEDTVRMRLALKAGAQIDQEEIIKSMGTYVELLYMLFSNNAANDSDLDALANILKYVSYEDALTFIRKGGLFDEITQNAIADVLIDRLANPRETDLNLLDLFLTLHITDDQMLKKLISKLDESPQQAVLAELKNPLILALLFNDHEQVKNILSRLARQEDFEDYDEDTISLGYGLIFASGQGDVALVNRILSTFPLELSHRYIASALRAAALQGEVETFEALVNARKMPRIPLVTALNDTLITAAAQRHIPLVESILRIDRNNPTFNVDIRSAAQRIRLLLNQDFSPDLRADYETIRTMLDEHVGARFARRIMHAEPPPFFAPRTPEEIEAEALIRVEEDTKRRAAQEEKEEEESTQSPQERLKAARNEVLSEEEESRNAAITQIAQEINLEPGLIQYLWGLPAELKAAVLSFMIFKALGASKKV